MSSWRRSPPRPISTQAPFSSPAVDAALFSAKTNPLQRMWLLFAFSGPVLWAISTHIDKYLVEKYFRHSSVAVLLVFTSLIGVVMLPFNCNCTLDQERLRVKADAIKYANEFAILFVYHTSS
jgi:hypothetical protein